MSYVRLTSSRTMSMSGSRVLLTAMLIGLDASNAGNVELGNLIISVNWTGLADVDRFPYTPPATVDGG